MSEIISQVTEGVSGGIKGDVMSVLTALVSILLIICGGRLLYELIIRSSKSSGESKGIFAREENEEEK